MKMVSHLASGLEGTDKVDALQSTGQVLILRLKFAFLSRALFQAISTEFMFY